MAKLTDIQILLLTSAAARSDGSVLPPPEQLAERAPRIRTAIIALLKRSLIEETDSAEADRVWREDGDNKFGLVITAAGRAEVTVEATPSDAVPEPASAHPTTDADQKPLTKAGRVLTLLQREQGATLAELVEATGWLPHTTRAALTGLRKKGHAIAKGKRDDITCYGIAVAVAA